MVPEQIKSGHNGLRQIEDTGKHSAETLAKLQCLLWRGSQLIPDPKREHIYEVAAGRCVYYIHVSPVSGKVSLLAVWGSQPGIDCAGRRAA